MNRIPGIPARAHRAAFTLMEILVVIAIILVLAAIAFPVISVVQQRSSKAVAINNMRQLATAFGTYTSQNDGTFPAEDAKGPDTWQNAANEAANKAWYNALPKILGQKTVGEFATSPRDFYTKANLIWLPGAKYPESDKKLKEPLFAIAINTKLSQKDASGTKEPPKMSMVQRPSRTVMFLEQGLPSEPKAIPTQPKYDGSCKGSAKSFVTRYGTTGIMTFMDGHAEAVDSKDLLTETGRIPFPQTDIVWTKNPDDDPNAKQHGQ